MWYILWLIWSSSLFFVGGTRTIVDVLSDDANFSHLIRALQATELIPTFNRYNHTTLFAPSNKAFERDFALYGPRSVWSDGNKELSAGRDDGTERREAQRQILLYHSLPYLLNFTAGTHIEQTHMYPKFSALAGQAQVLRVTKFEDGSLMIGQDDLGRHGVSVEPHSHKATDGYVYTVDEFVTLPDSLAYQIHTLPELSRWKAILPSWFLDQLRYQPHLTAFLPTNRAFEQNPLSNEDPISLFGRHVSGTGLKRGQIGYSKQFEKGDTVLRSISGTKIIVKSMPSQSLQVKGVGSVSRQDIFASNGVTHLIDGMLPLPDQNQGSSLRYANTTLTIALTEARASKFLKLIESANLSDWVEEKVNEGKYTILAPRDDVLDLTAFPWNIMDDVNFPLPLPYPEQNNGLSTRTSNTPSLKANKAEISKIVKYHLLPGLFLSDDLEDGMLIESELQPRELSGFRQRVRVTLNHNSRKETGLGNGDVTFGDAGVISEPYKFEQGIIYLLSNLLEPPQDAVTALIRDAPRLSTFIAAVYAANMAMTLRNTPGTTYIVPTNTAFSKLGLVERYLLLPQARSQLRGLVKYHGIVGIHYLANFDQDSHQYPTLSNSSLIVERSKNGSLYVHGQTHADHSLAGVEHDGRIIEGDFLISTGVMHIVDQVQIPPTTRIGMKELILGGDADTFLDMLRLTNLTWVMNATTCNTNVDTMELVHDGRHVSANNESCDPAFTIFAPNDKAFTQTNLTELFDSPAMLMKVVRQHIAVGSITSLHDNVDVVTLLSKEYLDKDPPRPRQAKSKYGTLFLRRVGPGNEDFLLGIKGARNSGGLEGQFGLNHEFAQIVAGGRTTDPVGGGLFTIDNVLWPYRPTWWEEWQQTLGLLVTLTVLLGGAMFYAWKSWRKRMQRRGSYTPIANYEEI